jgi:hypothetical protein
MRRSDQPPDLVRATVGGALVYGAKFGVSMLGARGARSALRKTQRCEAPDAGRPARLRV